MTDTFRQIFDQYNWKQVEELIYSSTKRDVELALNMNSKCSVENFAALISPAADDYIEVMAVKSNRLTQKRFGKTIQMYLPMYLSNECQNICTYCGFSFDNKINRLTLSDEQILKEVEVIKNLGYDHLLLVTGEANNNVGIDYLLHAVEIIKPFFSNISIEVQPLKEDEYKLLNEAGVYSVLVYQETYHEENYPVYHPKGKKSNFNFRLETPERIGEAGMHKMGLGVLLGLEDWRADSFFTALHLQWLEKKYWRTKFSISFPRLRPATGCQKPNHPMTDRQLVQLICAWRIFDENLELSISTRESASLRNKLIPLGITSMSAGSKTDPGGYAGDMHALEQFEISDERSPVAVAEVISLQGYEAVWKDWDHSLS